MRTRYVRQRVSCDIKCIRTSFERIEDRRDFVGPQEFQRDDFKPERASCPLHIAHLQHSRRIAAIGHDCQSSKIRNHFAQEFKSLPGRISHLARQSRDIAARPREARHGPAAERVRGGGEDDRDDRCRLLHCGHRTADRDDDVYLATARTRRRFRHSARCVPPPSDTRS